MKCLILLKYDILFNKIQYSLYHLHCNIMQKLFGITTNFPNYL